MTHQTDTSASLTKRDSSGGGGDGEDSSTSSHRSWLHNLGPGTISIVYLYAAGFILFAIWIPDTWLSAVTHQSVLNIAFAIPGLAAMAVLIPLTAGTFDLSIAGTMSASAVTTSWLLVNHHWSMWPAIGVGMCVALIAGAVNGVLVVVVRINSFIATLATNAVLAAYAEWRSGGIQITGFPQDFTDLSAKVIGAGVQIKVLYLAIIAVVIWYVLEHTPVGRYLQATGDNPGAARLAGVRTPRYVFGSLIASALIAGFAGIVDASTIGAGSSTLGDSFLLPAFAAAFLGSTQFKRRFNVWGTLAAIWVLASGVQGVTLAVGSFSWLNNLFFGVALIVAVGSSSLLERWQGFRAARARSGVAADATAAAEAGSGAPPARAVNAARRRIRRRDREPVDAGRRHRRRARYRRGHRRAAPSRRARGDGARRGAGRRCRGVRRLRPGRDSGGRRRDRAGRCIGEQRRDLAIRAARGCSGARLRPGTCGQRAGTLPL